jgi:hypothetical protein
MRDLCSSRIRSSSGLVHKIHEIILVRFEGARQANDPPSPDTRPLRQPPPKFENHPLGHALGLNYLSRPLTANSKTRLELQASLHWNSPCAVPTHAVLTSSSEGT